MKPYRRIVSCLFVLVMVVGCASTEVTNRQILLNDKLPRPDRIWVYHFTATSAEVPAESALAGKPAEPTVPQTAEQLSIARQMGILIAEQLVDEIRDMALPAMKASRSTTPQVNDIVIRGYLLSVDEGSATKRVVIGFGSGASELKVAVEGFQMTDRGLRKLGSGDVTSSGGKTPGGALGVIALIATANPAGLIVGGGMKVYREYSGSAKIEGRSKETAKEIAKQIRPRFEQQGWITAR